MPVQTAEHRLFFAARLDEAVGARAHRLARRLASEHRLRGSPIPADRLHVSLSLVGRGPGCPSAEVMALARLAGDRVAFRPFKTALKRVQSWRRSRGPLVLVGDDDEVIGLRLLHEALAEARGRAPSPHFEPHVSLIWTPDFVTERVVETLSWTVRELVLIHSIHGRSRHEILRRWPLTG